MKKLSLLLCCCVAHALSFGQVAQSGLSIIPEPVKTTRLAGQFLLPKSVIVEAGSQPEWTPVTAYLKKKLSTARLCGPLQSINGSPELTTYLSAPGVQESSG